MLQRRISGILLIGLALTSALGCRSNGASYHVKWAKRQDDVVSQASSSRSDDDVDPIQQTSANSNDAAAIAVDTPAQQRRSGWASLFRRFDKPQRVKLPRTDLPIDGEEEDLTAPQQSTFDDF